MSSSDIQAAIVEYFGISLAQLRNHDHRDADTMDARAAVAFVLYDRMGYSGRRAAKALGYKDSTLTYAWERLRLRVYSNARLRGVIGLLFPKNAKRVAA